MIRKAGKGQLMLVTADGSESRRMTGAIDAQGAADWAPDGSAIVTGGSDEQGLGLFRIPIDGGTPVRLAKALRLASLAQGTTRRGPLQGLPRARPEGPSRVVRKGGLEPPRYCYRQPLKLVRLPIPPLPRGGQAR